MAFVLFHDCTFVLKIKLAFRTKPSSVHKSQNKPCLVFLCAIPKTFEKIAFDAFPECKKTARAKWNTLIIGV